LQRGEGGSMAHAGWSTSGDPRPLDLLEGAGEATDHWSRRGAARLPRREPQDDRVLGVTANFQTRQVPRGGSGTILPSRNQAKSRGGSLVRRGSESSDSSSSDALPWAVPSCVPRSGEPWRRIGGGHTPGHAFHVEQPMVSPRSRCSMRNSHPATASQRSPEPWAHARWWTGRGSA
jgi:hypothetical protein